MNPEELLYVGSLWEEYFPKEIFFPQDTRLTPVIMFRTFFLSGTDTLLLSFNPLLLYLYLYLCL
jgi:hypothetical protein